MNIIQPVNANNVAARFAQGARAEGLIGAYEQLPDLMNGDAVTLTPIYLSPGVEAMWKWVIPNAGPRTTNEELINAVLEVATMMCLAAGDPNDRNVRMASLIVAMARLIVTRSWNIAMADLEPAQRVVIPAAQLESGHTNLVPDYAADGPGTIAIVAKNAMYTELAGMFDADVSAFMVKLTLLAMGLPAMVGCSLVTSNGHHFVPTTAHIFRAVAHQVFQNKTPSAPGLDSAMTEDAMYHKAMHPIKTGVLVWIARNPACKQRINSSGLGSAAVRMPALFASEKSASAIVAVVRKALAASTEHNVSGNAQVIINAAADVTIEPDVPITAGVLSNSQDALAALEQTYGEHIGWCAGYLTAMMENANTQGGTATVLKAYSIRRIISDNEASYASGSQWYGIATRWRRQVISAGDLPGVGLFGETAPAAQQGSN